ncbi:MAG: hypothetical protein H6924_02940 [Alphaproteobacteria bacterium]|nr:hypothetical protein [Alphaproteobacteria bacterium]
MVSMTNRRVFIAQSAAIGVAATVFRPVAGVARPAGTNGPSAGMAQTVLGAMDADRLGCTLPHEHIADGPYFQDKWPNGGRREFTNQAVAQLKTVRAAGIDTIVDLTPYDVGRDIRFLEEVSRRSGIPMIACTGQRFFPPQYAGVTMPSRTIEGLAEFFGKEISQGIDGTGIRAGVIKIGVVGKEPTELEITGLRAAVRTSRATGVPIRIHTHAVDRAADNLVAILDDEGMNPAKVSFDHSDDSGDLDYFLGLVRRGYSLGMDHVHRGLMPNAKLSFERRAECIARLVETGFAGNVFLSQDEELGGSLLPEDVKDFRSRLDPPDGLLFTTRKLIPRLRQAGVSGQDIRVMTVENPRRFFGVSQA